MCNSHIYVEWIITLIKPRKLVLDWGVSQDVLLSVKVYKYTKVSRFPLKPGMAGFLQFIECIRPEHDFHTSDSLK